MLDSLKQLVSKQIDECSKVLIVDDVPANLLALSALLEETDVDVHQAKDGNEALHLVLEHDFCVVLLDVQMPEMDGYEVAQIMRSNQQTKHMPIIFLTANSRGRENRLKGYQAGAVDYLEKPIEEESLLAKVAIFKELDAKNRALEKLQRKTEVTLGSIPDPVLCVHNDEIVYMNGPAIDLAKRFGCDSECHSLREMFAFSTENLEMIQELVQALSDNTVLDESSVELMFSVPGMARPLTYEFRVAPLKGRNNTVNEVVLIFHDVSRLRILSEELSHQAFHDALTHLPNRRFLEDAFNKALARYQRKGSDFAIMLIDLDNFKRVNDTAGHSAGDFVLCEAADRITKCLRGVDTLCRIGGDEFCVLLEDVDSLEGLEIPAQRIVSSVSGVYLIDDEEYEIGASIGITSSLNDEARDLASMMTDADLAMYQAKSHGKNQFVFFDTAMRQDLNKKIRLDKELVSACSEEEFCLHYQPQISVIDGSVIGMEALIRWQHPERGLLFPGDFIMEMEANGLIKAVGSWVIDETCRQIAAWRQAGINVPCISINVSPQQFEQKGLHEEITLALEKHEVEAKYLGIEITESLFMTLTRRVEQNLKKIHKLGCKISMDDFGTGYSSLSYLLRFPVDVIKIDRSFIQNMTQIPQNRNMVKTIISLGHGFDNKTVMAEGVEDSSVLALLDELGCDAYQGFLFSKALPAESVVEKLVNQSDGSCQQELSQA